MIYHFAMMDPKTVSDFSPILF